MPFAAKKQVFRAKINEVTLGVGENAVKLGGQSVPAFYAFDAEIPSKPKIGVEITDIFLNTFSAPGILDFYAGCTGEADMARKAETIPGVSFVCMHFVGADPNGLNRPTDECVRLAQFISKAISLPLVIMGCKNIAKDTELFLAIGKALAGKNVLFLSARDENYQALGKALTHEHKIGAESAVDINLAKQLNTVMTQSGTAPQSIVMNVGSAAAGYGYEYVASTLDRIRDAALRQSDEMLQMPIIAPICSEVWSVKEATASQDDMPEWGDREQRGIEMEITTAAAALAGGCDAVILRHPEAIRTIAEMIDVLS